MDTTVADDLDVPVEIGAVDADAGMGGERGQRLRGGMAVLVALARRDDRQGRTRGVEQPRGGRRVRAVVADLQQVDRPKSAAGDERRLDRRFGITGEKRGEPAVAQEQDHRTVVDVAFGQRRGRVGRGRVNHLERGCLVEREHVAGASEVDRDRGAGGIGQQAVVGRVLEVDAGVDQEADAEAIEHVDQPGDVVLVRMAEHQQVDATC
jgi:hypothetical protein